MSCLFRCRAVMCSAVLFISCMLTSAVSAQEYFLTVDDITVDITGKPTKAMGINGSIPGPLLRFQEGKEAVIHITNNLNEPTSMHWHGLLLPGLMDGVPGFNGFKEIEPGDTFTFRYELRQSGTYWYHSHSGFQEQAGVYGPMIIEPKEPDPAPFDREYVVMLSDFTEENPASIMRNLKIDPAYYNYAKRTVIDFFKDADRHGWKAALQDRAAWGEMRMDPTDLADVTGYTFLINGQTAEQNPAFDFKPGERIRLRFINGSAMTFFDVRIPGLKMSVVEADGRDVQPVPVDEFRIAVAETYDVIVEPQDDRDYTIFAGSIDRTGFARATLKGGGIAAPSPKQRPRAVLNMADMGMSMAMGDDMPADSHHQHEGEHKHGDHAGHEGHTQEDHERHMRQMRETGTYDPDDVGASHDHSTDQHKHQDSAKPETMDPSKMDPSKMDHSQMPHAGIDHSEMGHGDMADTHTDHSGHGDLPSTEDQPRGWGSGFPEESRVLSYADLKSLIPNDDLREPGREIVVNLTGNMERYLWTLNGLKFSEADPIQLRYGERVRMTFVNDTMMSHPMHLHGMYVELDNGQTTHKPEKHVVNVPPGESYSVLITADEPGEWAFHCHLQYHMAAGMMRKVVVAQMSAEAMPQ